LDSAEPCYEIYTKFYVKLPTTIFLLLIMTSDFYFLLREFIPDPKTQNY